MTFFNIVVLLLLLAIWGLHLQKKEEKSSRLGDGEFGEADLVVISFGINKCNIMYTPTQIHTHTHIWIWSKQAAIWLISADGQHTIYMAQGEPGGS